MPNVHSTNMMQQRIKNFVFSKGYCEIKSRSKSINFPETHYKSRPQQDHRLQNAKRGYPQQQYFRVARQKT